MFHSTKMFLSIILFSILVNFSYGEVKETHKIIEEWVKTKQLYSEEESTWKSEKATLVDIEDALVKEIEELEEKLLRFKEENIGTAQQRVNLTSRKENAKVASLQFYEGMQKIEKEIKETNNLLPSPLRDRLFTFYEKIDSSQNRNLPLRNRLEASVALLQSVHLFHRSVHLERQEFKLDDGKSREFRVIYFGLGVAYFVNESGNVAGWGKPSESGWNWTRQDELAKEISTGVSIMENRAMPRFLELPIPLPSKFEK